MSFGFQALGTKDEIVAQLKEADVSVSEHRFNYFGADIRKLLMEHFGHETAHAGHGYEYRYVVKANGHGGGTSPLSVQLTIEPLYVRAAPVAAASEG